MKPILVWLLAISIAIAPASAFAGDKVVSCSGSCTVIVQKDSPTLYEKAVEAGALAVVVYFGTQAATTIWAYAAAALASPAAPIAAAAAM